MGAGAASGGAWHWGQKQQPPCRANLPGNFYYFFKHFLELSGGRTHLYLNFFFSFLFWPVVGRKEGALGVGECFVFALMGNFLGSKWARFTNAFVGCLWGGGRPGHPPWPRPTPHASPTASLAFKWNIKFPLALHLSN